MHIESLFLEHVRIIEQADIRLTPGINLFYGNNGSGKTSVLEAVNLLSRGKSFRSSRIQELVQRGSDQMQVRASIVESPEQETEYGFSRYQNKSRLRHNHTEVQNLSDQALRLPLAVQTTNSHDLLIGGPKTRRKWLDWLLFHVKPDYMQEWKDYHRVLRHRNHALRTANIEDNAQISAWDQQLVVRGMRLQGAMMDCLQLLNPALGLLSTELLGEQAQIDFLNTIEDQAEYLLLLEKNHQSDQQKGYTGAGPHAANLQLQVGGLIASKVLSRGQSKLLICSLLLAHIQTLTSRTATQPIVLIDDLAAELDGQSCGKLMASLKRCGAQCLVTTTEDKLFRENVDRRFHVEQGKIQQQ